MSTAPRDFRAVLWTIPLLAIACSLGLRLLGSKFAVTDDALTDPDTVMRLTVVRNILAHGWDYGFLPRDNAPYGMTLHWTKPFYYLVVAIVRGFSFLPPNRALLYGAYFTGPILAIATALVSYCGARGLVNREVAMATALGIVLCPKFRFYFGAGVASHHSALTLIFIALIGLAVRVSRTGRQPFPVIAAGLLAGLGVWISPEALPFAGGLFALFFLDWIRRGDPAVVFNLLLYATAFGAMVLLAVLVDPPAEGYRSLVLDRVAVPILDLSMLPLLVIVAMQFIRCQSAAIRLLYVSIASGLVLFCWWFWYFHVLDDRLVRMNPVVLTEQVPSVFEGLPVRKLARIVCNLGNGILAIGAFAAYGRRSRWYIPVLATLLFLGFIGQTQERFTLYFWIAGTITLGWCLQQTVTGLRARHRKQDVAWAMYTIGLIAAGFVMAAGCQFVLPFFEPRNVQSANSIPACAVQDTLSALNDSRWLQAPASGTPIFETDFYTAQAMLYFTPYSVVAGGYHRDSQGVNDSILFFRDLDGQTARNIATERGIDFVLLCPRLDNDIFGVTSSSLFWKYLSDKRHIWPQTLFRKLENRNPPFWLEPVQWPSNIKSDLLLYRVRGETAPR